MLGGNYVCAIGEATSIGTAAVMNICVGFVPDAIELIVDWTGTPIKYDWYRKTVTGATDVGGQPQVTPTPGLTTPANSDDALRTANNGTMSIVTSAIDVYWGNDKPSATDVTNKKYVDDTGTAIAAAKLTPAGFVIKSGIQVNSAKMIWRAYRQSR